MCWPNISNVLLLGTRDRQEYASSALRIGQINNTQQYIIRILNILCMTDEEPNTTTKRYIC